MNSLAVKNDKENIRPASPGQAKPPMRATRLIRRIHMYAGLVFLPWVLLYGFTALLFNHPTLWARRKPIDKPAIETMFQGWPEADVLAADGAKALTAAAHTPLGSVTRIENARYTGTIRAFVTNGSGRHEFLLRPDDRSGNWVKIVPGPGRGGEAELGPSVSAKEPPQIPNKQGVVDDLTKLAANVSLTGATVDVNAMPQLRFDAYDSRGGRWDTTWNLDSGSLKARPVAKAVKDLGWREYLTRLHTTGQYPAKGNWDRFAWAIIVDAVFVLMVFWGASGIVMWWQQRRMRTSGAVVLSIGAVTAVLLGVALWGAFVS